MQLYFCEKCGKRVSDVDIKKGRGKLVGGLAWCTGCQSEAPVEEAVPGAPVTSRSASRARRPSSFEPAPLEPPDGSARRWRWPAGSPIPAIAAGGGVVVGLIVGLVVFYSTRSSGPPDLDAGGPPKSKSSPARAPGPKPAPGSEQATAAEPPAPGRREPSPGPARSAEATPPREQLFVGIREPSTGKVLKTGSNITVDVYTFGGDGTVAKVEFFRGSTKIGEARGDQPSITWRNVPEGEHKLRAKVTDGSGNTGESSEVPITVRSRIPGVFVEAETGVGDADSKGYDGASGRKALSAFRGAKKKIEFVIQVTRRIPDAHAAVRGASGNGQTTVSFGPVGGKMSGRGSFSFPGNQKFVWRKRALKGAIDPGKYRLQLTTGQRRGGGVIDVVGVVSGPAFDLLPNRVAGGRLEQDGWEITPGVGKGAPRKAASEIASRPPAPPPPPAEGAIDRATCESLAKSYDKDKVLPKRIGAIGGGVAASSYFDQLLKTRLPRVDGYRFASKLGLAGRGKKPEDLKPSLERRLDDEKPEVVRICFDAREIRRAKIEDRRADIGHIVAKVQQRGAIPVLYTLAQSKQKRNKRFSEQIQNYNTMIVALAKSLKVPVLNAYDILNADEKLLSKYYSGNSLTPEGYGALNESFLALYGELEEKVLGRGREAAGRRQPGTVGRVVKRPGSPGAAAASGGNLVVNGGFERRGTRAEVAEGWTKDQWGSARGKYSVRHDRSNPRTGDMALVARASADEVHPGARAAFGSPLEPGTYAFRFWACTDVGKKAEVRGHFAGQDLPPADVGEEWVQIKMTVGIEEKQKRPELRFFTTTRNVRVWFDDVEVARTGE